MEAISLYYSVITITQMLQKWNGQPTKIPDLFFYGLIGVGIWLVFFILQGIGLSTMAKKRGIGDRWRAFVPFVNIYLMGQLVGSCQFFGARIKRAGTWVMLAQIVATLVLALSLAAEIYLWVAQGQPIYLENNTLYWPNLSGFAVTIFQFYRVSSVFVPFIQLIYEVLMLVLMLEIYKRYYPKKYTLLGILYLFVPMSRFIAIFVLRNREPIDFAAYMRARREAYIRAQQQRYGQYGSPNEYGNPYQNPYASSNPQASQAPPEEPFAEFASQAEKDAGQKADGNHTTQDDDFFS